MKVSELTGAKLDYWVARVEGVPAAHLSFPYSREWHLAGPLIEKYGLAVVGGTDQEWYAMPSADEVYVGGEDPAATPLLAICRAVVRAKFGDEVPESEA